MRFPIQTSAANLPATKLSRCASCGSRRPMTPSAMEPRLEHSRNNRLSHGSEWAATWLCPCGTGAWRPLSWKKKSGSSSRRRSAMQSWPMTVYDPYLEHAATVWLAHWGVASSPEWTTTAYFAFNVLSAIEFDTGSLIDELMTLVRARGWRATQNTLKRDVEVFLRSYVRRDGMAGDDAAEPLLAELGLIREARVGGLARVRSWSEAHASRWDLRLCSCRFLGGQGRVERDHC